ncbi:MAG: UDP-N-acetylglucosamine 2-epimerase (non-hydrolyzing), partial [Flavobacterium sp.]|nr:UDP-N-acetylglucosamine 2-epimerase (non-hydrolyzing) [Flavobacterium sp.]
APIIHALKDSQALGGDMGFRLIHTGQHYDKEMSGNFFEQLNIPSPDFNLGVGSGTQAEQTAGIMTCYEKILATGKSECCLVVGDVTSTMACSIVAQKMGVPVAHVEGGIRSGDWSMPEEINRMVTDSITNWFFTTSEFANANLRKMGIEDERIFFVGNTMIDTLLKQMPFFFAPPIWEQAGLEQKKYFVVTLHRPSNVDGESHLKKILEEIILCSRGLPVVFPVHPRTAKNLESLGLNSSNLFLTKPLGYLEFNYLVKNAFAVITDSGGITEEASVMRVPCMTVRNNTERPETTSMGTNVLIGTFPEKFKPFFSQLFDDLWPSGGDIPLWDGNAGKRIVAKLRLILT